MNSSLSLFPLHLRRSSGCLYVTVLHYENTVYKHDMEDGTYSFEVFRFPY